MNVKIQSVKFDADKKLIDFTEGKLAKLERFAEDVILADVIMKLDKDNDNGNKVVNVRLEVPGDVLVSESRSKSFEESVDECIDALRKQIEKRKGKF